MEKEAKKKIVRALKNCIKNNWEIRTVIVAERYGSSRCVMRSFQQGVTLDEFSRRRAVSR